MFENGNGSKKYVESESREARMLADAQQKVLNSTQWLTADQLSIFMVSTDQNPTTTPNEMIGFFTWDVNLGSRFACYIRIS